MCYFLHTPVSGNFNRQLIKRKQLAFPWKDRELLLSYTQHRFEGLKRPQACFITLTYYCFRRTIVSYLFLVFTWTYFAVRRNPASRVLRSPLIWFLKTNINCFLVSVCWAYCLWEGLFRNQPSWQEGWEDTCRLMHEHKWWSWIINQCFDRDVRPSVEN